MSGMCDGYVGTAQDAVRIRRLEKQREEERRKLEEKKNNASAAGPGLLLFGSGTSEILETAFKKETIGLVTREQYAEKRVNIRNKIEEEEKEKLQKMQQEEEELQMQKRKKRRVKSDSRLSFVDEIENGSEEEEMENIVRCQSNEDAAATEVLEGSDLGIVGDDTQVFSDLALGPASGIETICVFPKNAAKLVPAGEETELLVGLHNEGDSTLNVVAIHASLHLPFDHRMFVQNLTVQEFHNATVPISTQATFPYLFAVSKFLQPGTFDLVAKIDYEIDQQPYQNVFYNGTIEVVEAGGFLSVESVFLGTLALALLALLGLWGYGRIQQLSKKTKKAPKVEVGTRANEADMDEWLQGTAYAQSLSSKSNKKK